jgi:hypothetical protein
MEDYNCAMFTHAMDFFKEHASLKKPIPKYFFTILFNDLLSTKFMKPQKQLCVILGRQA